MLQKNATIHPNLNSRLGTFCKEKRRKHERLTLSEWRCSAQTHGLERKTAKMAHFGKAADIQKLTAFQE